MNDKKTKWTLRVACIALIAVLLIGGLTNAYLKEDKANYGDTNIYLGEEARFGD